MTSTSLPPRLWIAAVALAVGLAAPAVWFIVAARQGDGAALPPPVASRPALTVVATTPQVVDWPRTLAANGNIAAWQEAVIGAEISNYRLTEVLVNVGDTVRQGQVLARIASDTVAAELTQARAAVAEAEATLAEARVNAGRARQLQATGFVSAQQTVQYVTAEETALARLNAARARVQNEELRLAQTQVRAPDAGVISARSAAVGSLTQPGQELFRLIRDGRLEWRAEVTAAELGQLKPGTAATLTMPDGTPVHGRVRMLAPTVDAQTRNALVYVDLPADKAVRAGMFARGEFEIGRASALTLPQSAVLLRDGFAYVFRLDGDERVVQTKVTVGRRSGDRIEITAGIDAASRVVAGGAGFLADGDKVRVVAATTGQ